MCRRHIDLMEYGGSEALRLCREGTAGHRRQWGWGGLPPQGLSQPVSAMPGMSMPRKCLVWPLLDKGLSQLCFPSGTHAGAAGKSCFPGMVREGSVLPLNSGLVSAALACYAPRQTVHKQCVSLPDCLAPHGQGCTGNGAVAGAL